MALAGYLPPIVAQIIADTKGLSAGLGEAEKKLGGFQGALTKMAGVGKLALAGLAAAAVGVGYESVKMAMNFDQAMELIHTQAGASQAEVDSLKNSVLALAPTVGIGPEQLAEGLYHIESTGLRGKAALDVLTQSAKLAQIGMANLDDVTYAMSGVMSVGMKDVHSAADAISFMNATVGMGDMRMGQLAAAIGTGILPSMKSAGLGMVDFSAAIATLADNSVPADEAATRLRMTIAMMSAPSGKAADALASIGIKGTQLADDMRKPDGLLVAVMDLKKHLEAAGLTASQQNQVIEHAFGGGRTSGAILTLLEESDKLKSKYEQMGTAANRAKVTNQAWAAQQKQFKQQLDQLVATLQAWGVKIGNFLIPKIQELMSWMTQHKELMKVIGIAVGALTVAFIALTVAMWAASLTPISLIIAGITLAVIALGIGIYELVTHWGTVWGFIKKIAGDAWHWIYSNVWVPIRNLFITPFIDAIKVLKDAWSGNWKQMGKDLKDIYDHTIGPIIGAISWGVDSIAKAMGGSGVKGAAQDMFNKVQQSGVMSQSRLPRFDAGGVVPGPVGAPQLAVVHGGETVTPAGGSSGDIVIHQRIVTADGKTVRNQTLRYARRAGLKATDVYSVATVSGNLVRT